MSLFDNFGSSQSSEPPGSSKRSQFINFVKLHTYADGYIDQKEERKILEYAIGIGVALEEALAVLRDLATQQGWVLERDAENRAKDVLAQFAASGGVVDKKEFEDAVTMFRTACKNKINDPEARRRLKQMMLDNGWKAKEGGLFGSKWFSQIG